MQLQKPGILRNLTLRAERIGSGKIFLGGILELGLDSNETVAINETVAMDKNSDSMPFDWLKDTLISSPQGTQEHPGKEWIWKNHQTIVKL